MVAKEWRQLGIVLNMSNETMTADKWISAGDAADILNEMGVPTHRRTIENWIKRGQLEFIELPSGRRLVRKSDIETIVTPKRLAHAI